MSQTRDRPIEIARRAVLGTAATAAATTGLAAASLAQPGSSAGGRPNTIGSLGVPVAAFGAVPDVERDQSQRLQAAIDECARSGAPLLVPPGRWRTSRLMLRPGSRIIGTGPASVLELHGGGPLLLAEGAASVALEMLAFDGRGLPLAGLADGALVRAHASERLRVVDCTFRNSGGSGVSLSRVSGRISDCAFEQIHVAAIRSLDAAGLEIAHNHIADVGNNGVLVWRSAPGDDGTIVSGNRIERVGASDGGSGQNGNGINVFRAGGVLVTGNRIIDCAYSAVRGNAASNIQIVGNSCQRLGEVALYAEFGFEGALICGNLIDRAATGISVTNFNEGGRLAVVQGNLVRNAARREHEPQDKRGEGIFVEADAAVTGNVVESAETAGIVIGWGEWMRDCIATGNLIRDARVGIAVSGDEAAGSITVAQNMISGARDGGIRAMLLGTMVGPDLTRTGQPRSGRLQVFDNTSV